MPCEEDFLERGALVRLQEEKLRRLLEEVLGRNRFYTEKFAGAGIERGTIGSIADLARLPFTTKGEILADQASHPPYGSNLTYPVAQYCRLHQTSGTRGSPLRWLDTAQSWDALVHCWERMYRIAGIGAGERLFFAFSFGPFLGFWTGFEAASRIGCLCLAGGGLSSGARLRMLLDNRATVLLCTPTYALHLAEVARNQGIDLASAGVKTVIVAGEPGGSIPATRACIEAAWNARVLDHSGMTEVGPMAIECPPNPAGLHILESEYLVEVIDPASGRPAPPGTLGELVVTNLHRLGSPLLRYRTGDLVKVDPRPCPCGRTLVRLEGGILGRTDDMVHLRGNNFYPAALENVLRRFAEVVEYRVTIDEASALAELKVEVEAAPGVDEKTLAEKVALAIRDELLFRADVTLAPPGTLPRFEMKAQRIQRK